MAYTKSTFWTLRREYEGRERICARKQVKGYIFAMRLDRPEDGWAGEVACNPAFITREFGVYREKSRWYVVELSTGRAFFGQGHERRGDAVRAAKSPETRAVLAREFRSDRHVKEQEAFDMVVRKSRVTSAEYVRALKFGWKPEYEIEEKVGDLEKFRAALGHCENVAVVQSGERGCIWASGDTKPHREELKALGFRWSPKRAAWYFKPAA